MGKPEDAKKAVECDGEGIGLFRTEFYLWIEILSLLKKNSLRHTRVLLRNEWQAGYNRTLI
ncbi:MAG: hypothetical protein ACLT2Z_01210 [Eubacterium sp.]